ncbi:MAG: PEGA domain-containing protein [Myxococcales bacterium]|nr:PEGA domain-containing protein [Myxococcales bacterium]
MRLILGTLAAAIALSFGARAQPDLALPLPAPAQPQLDLSPFLKNTSLCVFPFLKESARGSADKAYLESIQKTFFDVAKESPLLKDAVLMGPSLCDVRDTACFSDAGKRARCENVLVGSSAAKGNGYVLSVRMVEVARQRVMPGSEVEQVLETDRQADVQAWAEGQACRALQVKCVGKIYVDTDRKDMNIYVDNRLAPRTFKTPEQIAVEPGVHGVRVSVGQRTSLEKKVAVRRNGFSDLIYARQTEKGGLPLTLASELKGGSKPGPSVEVQEGGWSKPVGWTMLGAGALVAVFGGYELAHGNSQVSGANNAAAARGGAYTQSELGTLSSAHTTQTTGVALLVGAGVLLAAGSTLLFAF